MVDIIVGSTNKALASKELKKYFHDRKDYEGYLYIGYPIIGTVEGAYPIDALWISPINGIVIFNPFVELTNGNGIAEPTFFILGCKSCHIHCIICRTQWRGICKVDIG